MHVDVGAHVLPAARYAKIIKFSPFIIGRKVHIQRFQAALVFVVHYVHVREQEKKAPIAFNKSFDVNSIKGTNKQTNGKKIAKEK